VSVKKLKYILQYFRRYSSAGARISVVMVVMMMMMMMMTCYCAVDCSISRFGY